MYAESCVKGPLNKSKRMAPVFAMARAGLPLRESSLKAPGITSFSIQV